MKKILLPLLGLLLLTGRAAAETIEQADELYAARTETAGADKALFAYEAILAKEPNSVEALWKTARACFWIADHASDKKKKIADFEKGIAYVKRAVEIEPKSVEAHFWLAALWGSYGETKGVLKSLSLLKPIRKELETVNRLNDRYQGGAGYRVLGIVDYKVPGIAGGSKKRALEQLNKALTIDPSNPFNHYYAAEYFATAVDDKAKALEHLDLLRNLATNDDVDAPELKSIQTKGENLRRQLGT
jgi:tetratricopeptide (TPR) repeat protein